MRKLDREFDQSIVDALKKLPVPLKSARGSEIYFDNDKRYESIFKHIANKNHHLTIKDIKAIPAILLDKNSLKLDRSGKKFSTYIGRRGKQKERIKYMKIVTQKGREKRESVVTIYLKKIIIDKAFDFR